MHSLSRSPQAPELYAHPGNPGIFDLASPLSPEADTTQATVAAAWEHGIGLVVVGPEAYLEHGLVDECLAAGINAFGPTRSAARLETSKTWAKAIMRRASVPTAAYASFESIDGVRRYLREHPAGTRVVVKADGVAAGKGVLVTTDIAAATEFARACLREVAGSNGPPTVLVEQALDGEEVSLFSFVSGETVVPLGCARDYKRAYDGHEGPNTGGMGAISPVDLPPNFVEDATELVVRPVAREMARSGDPFSGMVFTGLMLTAGGPYVLEYNVRFGDPETQVLLPRLETDLLDLLMRTATGNLEGAQISLSDACTCGVTIASEGYPTARAEPRPVRLGELPSDTILYHAGTSSDVSGTLMASGGRVFTAVGLGDTPAGARARAYSLRSAVSFEGGWCRQDIGL